MIRYGYSQQKIENLSCIDGNANNWYNYKDLNFLIKFKNNNSNLVIFFHGALPDIDDRDFCFRGFNYDIEDTNIICVSDILISIYKNFQISWFLSSNKHNINDNSLKYISNAYYSPFVKFINDNNLEDILIVNLFNGPEPPEGKTHHHISFPNDEPHLSILKKKLLNII